uniref:GAGE domain-containing protein n=1 Tax=Sus scrofa TaxID=9823 RepID=A0A8D0V979_PIG
MSRRIKSTYRPKGRGYGQEYCRALGPVVPSGKQPQQMEPPTLSEDIPPGQEKKTEGASAIQGAVLEANQQELAEAKTGYEHEDGADVKKILPNPEPDEMPEGGMLSIKHLTATPEP